MRRTKNVIHLTMNPETDDELDDEITETDDETVSDKEEPVSEEVSEENKKTEEEPVSEEADEEPEDELALEEADEENSSEEEKTLSNNVNYDDDTDYPDYEMDVGFFDDLKIGDHKGIIIGVINRYNCCNRFYNDRYRNNRKLQK